eukprot:m.38332 g.38332  ORF g.38332 m.38332 type:complete len:238 (-) comp5883_c0_seq1:27-740(-)
MAAFQPAVAGATLLATKPRVPIVCRSLSWLRSRRTRNFCAMPLPLHPLKTKAFDIAHMACKFVIDDLDRFQAAPCSIDYLQEHMFAFFEATSVKDMLPHFYANFDKTKFASFAVEVAKGAEGGDPLCRHVLTLVGIKIARHIIAVSPDIDESLCQDGLRIICQGSVWKSLDLFKDSLAQTLQEHASVPRKISLVQLIQSAGVGAALLAARAYKLPVVMDYAKNTKSLLTLELEPLEQ